MDNTVGVGRGYGTTGSVPADSCTYYIDMLCERYRDRGIATHVRADAAVQERNEALTRAMAPGAYIKADKVSGGRKNKYRSGVYNGTRYMTTEDFAAYYRAQRAYRKPEYREAPAVTTAVTENVSEAGTPPKKELWLTETSKNKLPAVIRRIAERPVFVKLNELAADWFPQERDSKKDVTSRTKFPTGIMASLLTVAVALTMIISSSVMVSHATSEISTLKNQVSNARDQYDELYSKLELRNDTLMIEEKAREYGMVHSEYVASEYIGAQKDDTITAYKPEEKDAFDLSAILSAIGLK